jgi:hypothetical protein
LRAALMELLRATDVYVARELELTFEVGALQEQLSSVGAGLKPLGLEARYSGAGVVLSGEASRESHHRALWELFRRSVGRVPLEDRVEVKAPEPAAEPPDAGVAAEPVEVAPKKPKRMRQR